MSDQMLTALRVHAEVTTDDTAAKLLLLAAAEIKRLRMALGIAPDDHRPVNEICRDMCGND